jgi:hypothetical protein
MYLFPLSPRESDKVQQTRVVNSGEERGKKQQEH